MTHNGKIYTTRILGPYGPSILALAEGWLALLSRGLATLDHRRGLRPSTSSYASLDVQTKLMHACRYKISISSYQIFMTFGFFYVKLAVHKGFGLACLHSYSKLFQHLGTTL